MCRSENSKGVYCLQYDDEKIVSGLRDNTIKVRTSFYYLHLIVCSRDVELSHLQSHAEKKSGEKTLVLIELFYRNCIN